MRRTADSARVSRLYVLMTMLELTTYDKLNFDIKVNTYGKWLAQNSNAQERLETDQVYDKQKYSIISLFCLSLITVP